MLKNLNYSFCNFNKLGCGTGKYVKLKSDLFTIGCDRSQQLCEIVREKYSHIPILIADNLHLPYRDNLFDAVLSIGVIHHLTTHKRRVQAIQGCLLNFRVFLCINQMF
jgi:ubiquinone/menaquinone biosynthesis C-methylase UbiE